jgi:hypothetical protein
MFWTIVIVVFAVVLAAGWWVGRRRSGGSFRNGSGDGAVADAKRQSTMNKLSGPGAGWS